MFVACSTLPAVAATDLWLVDHFRGNFLSSRFIHREAFGRGSTMAMIIRREIEGALETRLFQQKFRSCAQTNVGRVAAGIETFGRIVELAGSVNSLPTKRERR